MGRRLPHQQFLQLSESRDGLRDLRVRCEEETSREVSNVLFAAPSGSHLHGTSRAESDVDLTGIFVSPVDSILLDRDQSAIRFSSADDSGRGGRPGELDAEFLELRTWLSDALDGHPYAIELLHVPEELYLVRSEIWDDIRARRSRIVSASVDPFIRYCRSRARRFGDRAGRLRTFESLLEILRSADRHARIETVLDDLPTDSDLVGLVEQSIEGRERPVRFLRVGDKTYELRSPVSKAIESLESTCGTRGESGWKDASDPPDWNSIGHAYRIAIELRELLETGGLEFPLREAEFLRRIRRGELPIERVERELPALVEDAIDTETDLPERPDRTFWEDWLVETYLDRAERR